MSGPRAAPRTCRSTAATRSRSSTLPSRTPGVAGPAAHAVHELRRPLDDRQAEPCANVGNGAVPHELARVDVAVAHGADLGQCRQLRLGCNPMNMVLRLSKASRHFPAPSTTHS